MARLAAVVLLGALAFSVNAAEVFRCVTENGVVRYSDKPCTDGKAEKLDIENNPTDPKAAAEAARQRQEKLAALAKAKSKAEKASSASAQKAAERESRCTAARERAQRLMAARRVTKGQGEELEFLDADEIVQRRQEAQDQVKKFCSN